MLAPHRKMGPIAALAAGRDHALLLTGGSDPWVAGWGRNKRRQVCGVVCDCWFVSASSPYHYFGYRTNRIPHRHQPTNKAHYACPAADTKGDLIQPTVLPLLLDPDIDAAAVVRGVVAGYDSSAVVVEEVG